MKEDSTQAITARVEHSKSSGNPASKFIPPKKCSSSFGACYSPSRASRLSPGRPTVIFGLSEPTMKHVFALCRLTPLASLFGAFLITGISTAPAADQPAALVAPKYPALLSETPDKFEPATSSFDYVKRKEMIPMRDGVKLQTVILIPQGAKGAPILLTRTPYDASELTSHSPSAHLGPILQNRTRP